jgi:CDP-diacylglycerol--glycerol-3-phosphate 3-phosphatidyltransferase
LLCGISDFADGFIARLLKANTRLGAKLDSLGDFVFFSVWLYILLNIVNIRYSAFLLICIVLIAIVRTTNFMITKVKFKQWSVMHTIGNKLTGFALFLILPICIIANSIPDWCIAIISLLALISALEETAILIKYKTYDTDRKCILSDSLKNEDKEID